MNQIEKTALIFGAGHGIGLGLVEELLQAGYRVTATYRNQERAQELIDLEPQHKDALRVVELDPLDANSLEAMKENLPDSLFEKLSVVINAIGFLTGPQGLPEKSLRDFHLESALDSFAINACVTPILLQALKPRFHRSKRFCFATLSAMVGSIGDNRIGGWYSYRASKTALNMFIKTASIEFKNASYDCSIVAIHPGTTETELSRQFLGAVKHKVWQPRQSAQHILGVIDNLEPQETGVFKNWDGETIQW